MKKICFEDTMMGLTWKELEVYAKKGYSNSVSYRSN